MAAQLRVYPLAPDDEEGERQEPTVRISMGDLLPLLTVAHRNNYLWLQDFLDDEVTVTPDLYEVLRAFRCRRPSA
jgi:hypothetical protein